MSCLQKRNVVIRLQYTQQHVTHNNSNRSFFLGCGCWFDGTRSSYLDRPTACSRHTGSGGYAPCNGLPWCTWSGSASWNACFYVL